MKRWVGISLLSSSLIIPVFKKRLLALNFANTITNMAQQARLLLGTQVTRTKSMIETRKESTLRSMSMSRTFSERWEGNVENDDEITDTNTNTLVAWRLGRVEKAVEQINRHSIERDEKILEKLEQIGEVSAKVSQNHWRITSLENSRTRIYQFMTAIALTVAGVVITRLLEVL